MSGSEFTAGGETTETGHARPWWRKKRILGAMAVAGVLTGSFAAAAVWGGQVREAKVRLENARCHQGARQLSQVDPAYAERDPDGRWRVESDETPCLGYSWPLPNGRRFPVPYVVNPDGKPFILNR
jgi:hypothetical protein